MKQAKQGRKKVRVTGSGHSWSPLTPTGDYLIDNRRLKRIGPIDVGKKIVTVESGVTIGGLDKELRRHGLAVPTNVVLTRVTYGGVIATGCHGAGWNYQTISDLVESMTIVLNSAEAVTFSEQTHGQEVMNAVRLNLGSFGVIYSMTIRVEPMFNLRTINQRREMELVQDHKQISEFAQKNDYIEIFWRPLTDDLWVKSWVRTDERAKPKPFYTNASDFITSFLARILYRLMVMRPGLTATINGFFNKFFVPKYHEVVRDAPDALHYRGFIELIPCQDMSFSIKVDEDFENVSRGWMLVVEKVRERAKRGEVPLNLVLELRVIRNSNILLSPAIGGEDEHHCYFEVISYIGTKGCTEFIADVGQAWMEVPEFQAKPHWAKDFYRIPNIIPYIHEAWGENMDKFATIRDQIDPDRMFLNDWLEQLFYGQREG